MKSQQPSQSTQNPSNTFGVVTFNHKMNKRKQLILITPLIASILQSDHWIINLVTLVKFNHWEELFQSVDTAKCMTLSLMSTIYADSMFNPLTYPRFTHLVKLDLTGNAIFNIENLAFIDAVNLQELILTDNCITTANFFTKLNFPKLQTIRLDKNYISQINWNRTKLDKNFRIIFFEEFNQKMTKNQDIAFISKMEPEKFSRNFGLFDENRIKQSQTTAIVKKKYTNVMHIKEYTEQQVQFLKLMLVLAGIQNQNGNQQGTQEGQNEL